MRQPSSTRDLFAVMTRVSPVLFALSVTVAISSAALPNVFALVTGQAVEVIHTAIRTREAGPVMGAAIKLAALYLASACIAPVSSAVIDAFARRVMGATMARSLAATNLPRTIDHLEDSEQLDLVEKARYIGPAGPRTAVVTFFSMWTARLQAVGALALIAAHKWWLGVVVAAGSASTWVFTHRAIEARVRQLEDMSGAQRRLGYIRSLALSGEAAKEVRIFGLAGWLVDRVDTLWRSMIEERWRARRHLVNTFVLGSLLRVACNVLAVGVLLHDAFTGDLTIGRLVTLSTAVFLCHAIILGSWDDFNYRTGAASVRAMRTLERAMRARVEPSLPPAPAPTKTIRFERAVFRYPGGDHDVLQVLDLEIPAGSSLALVGLNGAGKTTLVKLLCRAYDLQSGRLTVDGQDLAGCDRTSWQRRIAVIMQDFARYPFSVAGNVAPAGGADDAIVDAARLAGAHEFVEALASGYDTVLRRDLGGIDLSGGQWQRIAIARAVFAARAGAAVLVLDEPTAHLDAAAEAAFYERFLDVVSGVTAVVISHRFSTVRRADHIAVIEHGRVVEYGSHTELLELDGRYAHMFRLQSSAFSDA